MGPKYSGNLLQGARRVGRVPQSVTYGNYVDTLFMKAEMQDVTSDQHNVGPSTSLGFLKHSRADIQADHKTGCSTPSQLDSKIPCSTRQIEDEWTLRYAAHSLSNQERLPCLVHAEGE